MPEVAGMPQVSSLWLSGRISWLKIDLYVGSIQ